MSADYTKVHNVMEHAFKCAVKKIESGHAGSTLISDLFVQIDTENGEMLIFDDSETLLERLSFSLAGVSFDEESDFVADIATPLKSVLGQMSEQGVFDKESILKPFSISLTDEDFIIQEELLFLDDDTIRLDDALLEKFDKELDEFIDKLLSDIK